MSDIVSLLEEHDKLAGWAQFLGAMLALILTYLTAFSPIWRRKKQLKQSASRLLLNGYEAIESYHRTSANFLPFPLSIRGAALTMAGVAEEIDRFPLFELDDQGTRSLARHLVATSMTLKLLKLFLDSIASELDSREGTLEDQDTIRAFVKERMNLVAAMITGAEMKRPEWTPEQG